jgi:hypothetical protein
MSAYDEIQATTHAYLGYAECGCPCWIALDTPIGRKENAKEIAKFVRKGLPIERLPKAEAKDKFCAINCPH